MSRLCADFVAPRGRAAALAVKLNLDKSEGMTETQIRDFHASFHRCMTHRRFFDLFYDDFLNSSIEVRQKFQRTDFARQKRALRLSFLLVMDAVVHKTNDFSVLEPNAISHSRTKTNIPPHLYDLWLDSLLRTVKTCDSRYSAKTERLWREAFKPAIDYIVAKY